MRLEELLRQAGRPDACACEMAQARWNSVAKPLHSMGLLEDAVVKIAGIQGSSQVRIEKKALVILCADNGIVEEGVTQAGQEVTAVVTENFTKGDSCVCIMAERAGVDVFPVDMGVAKSLVHCGDKYPLLDKKIARGTRNFLKEPAMTMDETRRAVETGIQIAGMLKEKGYHIIATGEMGIGNTTTSSAVGAVLTGLSVMEMTGRGAGLSDLGLRRKLQVIGEAIAKYWPEGAAPVTHDSCGRIRRCMEVLSRVGGLDLAGLTGIFLGGAAYGLLVVIDGFISSVAALAAVEMLPGAADYMLASHVSAEPAAGMILDRLGLQPLIRAGLCLGEGTGAVAAMPLLDMAVDVYSRMSTFEEIQIEQYKPL